MKTRKPSYIPRKSTHIKVKLPLSKVTWITSKPAPLKSMTNSRKSSKTANGTAKFSNNAKKKTKPKSPPSPKSSKKRQTSAKSPKQTTSCLRTQLSRGRKLRPHHARDSLKSTFKTNFGQRKLKKKRVVDILFLLARSWGKERWKYRKKRMARSVRSRESRRSSS